MERIKLISFGTHNYRLAHYHLYNSAKQFGIDDIIILGHRSFKKTEFYKNHQNITKERRGAGYWLWKPYYIYEYLKKMPANQILLYCDAGLRVNCSLKPLVELVEKSQTGILLFENYQGSDYFRRTNFLEVNYYNLYVEPNKNFYWVKHDVFTDLNIDNPAGYNSPQVDACLMFFRKTDTALSFVYEWLQLCCKEQLITDIASKTTGPKNCTFFGHLHDQSIISCLAHKYKIELYRSPTQFGNHFKDIKFRVEGELTILPYSNSPKNNSPYGTLFIHTRQQNKSILDVFFQFLKDEVKLFYLIYFNMKNKFKIHKSL